MTEEQRFNLLDEPWIPVFGAGQASLREVFSRPDLTALGGTPLEKIALFKLLQAIAQAAHTPADDAEWANLGQDGLATACLAYLERWREAFWLYGPRPFLQFPAVKRATVIPYGKLLPHIASGNNTLFFQSQMEQPLTDSQKALLLLVNMSCCLTGKKRTDNHVVFSHGVNKKPSGTPGPALCSKGLLHSFLLGRSLRETVWLNLLTQENLATELLYENGVGTPPWEVMPTGEADAIAEALKRSLMGRLVPMARFYLLADNGVHSVDGIQHPDYLQGGMVDPSVTGDRSIKKPKMVWADPNKRPWRALPAMLSFLQQGQAGMRCLQLFWCVPRLTQQNLPAVDELTVWSGGICLSNDTGEQRLSGTDDVVESELSLPVSCLGDGEHSDWFLAFRNSMLKVESLGKAVYAAVAGYYKEEKVKNANSWAEHASLEFWQMAERHFAALVAACAQSGPDAREAVLRQLRGCVLDCYTRACPQETARQLQLWVQHRPFSQSKSTSGKG